MRAVSSDLYRVSYRPPHLLGVAGPQELAEKPVVVVLEDVGRFAVAQELLQELLPAGPADPAAASRAAPMFPPRPWNRATASPFELPGLLVGPRASRALRSARRFDRMISLTRVLARRAPSMIAFLPRGPSPLGPPSSLVFLPRVASCRDDAIVAATAFGAALPPSGESLGPSIGAGTGPSSPHRLGTSGNLAVDTGILGAEAAGAWRVVAAPLVRPLSSSIGGVGVGCGCGRTLWGRLRSWNRLLRPPRRPGNPSFCLLRRAIVRGILGKGENDRGRG